MIEALQLLARSDGIAVTLSPLSKGIIGGVFLVVLGLVIWMICYRKPPGTNYPDESHPVDEREAPLNGDVHRRN